MGKKQPQSFGEITVRRINVVDEDGNVQLVISNKERAPDWSINGATFERPKAAGMIFYNEEGCECGGLQFSGVQGEGIEARGGITFDRYQNDQVIGIVYDESVGKYSYGIKMWDRPTGLGRVSSIGVNSVTAVPSKLPTLPPRSSLPAAPARRLGSHPT